MIDRNQVSDLPRLVNENDAVVIDESQMVFRAGEKPSKEFLEWLERHRHYGLDIVLLCQRWEQLPASITRLVEVTTHFRKLGILGLSRRYQARVRGCPNERVVHRTYTGSYDPKVYALYSSYSSDTVSESSSRGSIWRSYSLVGIGLFLLYVVYRWWGMDSWSHMFSAQSRKAPVVASGASSAVRVVAAGVPGALPLSSSPLNTVVIAGTVCYFFGAPLECEYYTSEGAVLSADEIAVLTGLPVSLRRDRWGRARIIGKGVVYAVMGSSVDAADRRSDGGLFPARSGSGADR